MQFAKRKIGRATAVIAITVAASTVLVGCSSSSSSDSASGKSYSVAVLLASSQNGYNQAVETGVQDAIDQLGADVQVTVLDGGFNSDTQLAQLETAGTGDTYDGIIVVPNDGVSIAAAFPLANNAPVVTVLNPIGPDISDMQPQVDNVVSTVAVDPAAAAAKQADGVVTYCENINPCKVALLLGNLSTTLDTTRRDAYKSVLDAHPNIQIVATAEGQYDPDKSATAMANVLQANPGLNVILSNADQQSEGAQIALEDAGINPASVYITGGGGTQSAIDKTRAGTWAADYIGFPVSMGKAAMTQLYAALTGGQVESWIDSDSIGGIDPYATTKTLKENPNYEGEWVG